MNLYSSSHFGFNRFGVTERAARRAAYKSAPRRKTGSRVSDTFKKPLPRSISDTSARREVERIINRSIDDLLNDKDVPFNMAVLKAVYPLHVDEEEEDIPELVPQIIKAFEDNAGGFEEDFKEHKHLVDLIDLFYSMPPFTSEAIIRSLGEEIKQAQVEVLFLCLWHTETGEEMIEEMIGRRRALDYENKIDKRQKRREQRAEEERLRRMGSAVEKPSRLKLQGTTELDDLMAQMTLGAGAGAGSGDKFGRRRTRMSGSNKKASSFGRRRRTNRSGSKKKSVKKIKNTRR